MTTNANDPFDAISAQSLRDPPDDIYPITPDDDNDLSPAVRSLRVATGGVVVVTMRNGQKRTLTFASGETRFGRFARVWSTNTTASTIEGGV
jgi:hypothetical protein